MLLDAKFHYAFLLKTIFDVCAANTWLCRLYLAKEKHSKQSKGNALHYGHMKTHKHWNRNSFLL